MKDTMRTASVLEIYNSSIEELKVELNRAKVALVKEKAAKAGFHTLSSIVYIGCGMLIIISLVLLLASTQERTKSEQVPILMIMMALTGLGGFFGFRGWTSRKNEKLSQFDDTIKELDLKVLEIEKAIAEKTSKKKTLLEVEQVVVAKDLKDIKDDNEITAYTKPSPNEKVCPMCAETIKAAAKICRFCGHRFE